MPTDIARIIQWVVLVANGGINFLLQISIVNSFILMKKNSSGAKRRSAAQEQVYFRVDLCQSLLQRTGKRNSTTAEVPSVASYAPTCIPDSHNARRTSERQARVVPQRLFLGALHAMSASAKAIALPTSTIFKQK